jgi:hypothetical protein
VTGEQPQDTVFGRGSNVLEYWLAHAEGFDVVSRGKPRQRVQHVVVDRRLGSASVLVVGRTRGRRTRVIPVAAISAVDPFDRLLYLTPRRRARAAASHLGGAARSARRTQHAAFVWLRPRAVEAARAAQRESVRAGVWLRPRLMELGRLVAHWALGAYVLAHAGIARLRPVLVAAAHASHRHAARAFERVRPWPRMAGRFIRGRVTWLRARAAAARADRADVPPVRDGS